MTRLFPAALLAAVVAVAPLSARADAHAEELFQEGRAAMKNGDYTRALGLIQESYTIEPAPGTLLNVAECESHVGKLIEAVDHFKQLLAQLPAGDKRRPLVEERIAATVPRIPKLTVTLAAGAPTGAEVRRGDARVEPGAATPFDPGAIELSVTAPGRRARVVPIELKEGDAKSVTVEPGEPEAVTGPVTPPYLQQPPQPGVAVHAGGGNGQRTAGLVIGGVGALSLGVGVVTGIMALSKASTVKDHCDASLACDPEGVDAGSSGKTLSLVSTVTVAAGIVGVGVGAILILTSRKSAPATAVLPLVGPGAGGAVLVRRF